MKTRIFQKALRGCPEAFFKILMAITVLAGLIIGLTVTGCGSGGSFADDRGVEITCAEATSSPDAICTGVQLSKARAALGAIMNIPTVEYHSGQIKTNEFINTDMEAHNYAKSTARVYVVVDGTTVAGCGGLGGTQQTYPFEIASGSADSYGMVGTNYDICATAGETYYTVTIYNAAHLDMNTSGNPAIDEALSQAIVHFTFVDP